MILFLFFIFISYIYFCITNKKKHITEKLHTLGVIECEQPRTDLYTFNGRIELGPIHRKERTSIMTIELPSENRHALPLMTENLLLRGSRVKNTDWVIGCAVYTGLFTYGFDCNFVITFFLNSFTGQNTKLSLNSRLTRNKMSSSEKFVNKFLIFFLVLLITIVTISYFLKR